ncbi:MAG TPA: OsmC family protein [Gemmatimonadales bacterium]
MDAAQLRALQAPFKQHYRDHPEAARVTSLAEAELIPGAIQVSVAGSSAQAGLHSATGGDGRLRCSADMLLEALVACAGVTLQAVATAMGIVLRGGRVRAEGDWDARGTLGVSRDVPVGLTIIRLGFDLDSDATSEQLDRLLELVERYCVVAQTLRHGVEVRVERGRRS